MPVHRAALVCKSSCLASAIATMAVICCLIDPVVAVAQVGASVSGTVKDTTGGALPGVTVTITNKANGTSQTQVTGPEGNYRAVNLQPAPYEIIATLSGFAASTRTITLLVGADATIDLTLGVASVSESLTVTGASPLVEV